MRSIIAIAGLVVAMLSSTRAGGKATIQHAAPAFSGECLQ